MGQFLYPVKYSYSAVIRQGPRLYSRHEGSQRIKVRNKGATTGKESFDGSGTASNERIKD